MKNISRKDPHGGASAAETLRAVSPSDQATVNTTMSYLLTVQNKDGGWGAAGNDESSVNVTATVMLALLQYPQTEEIENVLNRAAGYLLSKQNADGGFGSNLSTVLETANAYIALASVISDAIVLGNATNYLVSSQFRNGSWNDDPSSTALVLKAFSCIESKPVLLPQEKTGDEQEMADAAEGETVKTSPDPAVEAAAEPEVDAAALSRDADQTGKPSVDEPDEAPSVQDGLTASAAKEDETSRETNKDKATAARTEAPQKEERTTKVSLVTRRKLGSSFTSEGSAAPGEQERPRISPASSRSASSAAIEKAFAGVSQQPTAKIQTVAATSVVTDKKEYRAHDVVTIRSEISNKGDAAVNLQISSRVMDGNAHIIGSASPEAGGLLKLEPSVSETAVLLWDTERHLPGAYSVELSIADASTGDILDEKKVAIDIVPTVSIDGMKLSVNPQYLDINETSSIVPTISFNNRSNIDAPLAARFTIKDTEGKPVHNGMMEFKLAMSEPLMVLDLPSFTYTFDQSGQYLVETEILSADQIVYAHAQAAVRVSSVMQIEVHKTLEPGMITPDGDKKVRMGIRLEGMGVVSNPAVLSAMTNTAGDSIVVAFDKAMNDPSGKQDQFSVVVDNISVPVAGAALKGSDITKINIVLGSPLDQYRAVQLSYTAGDVSSMDGKPLPSFDKLAVINKVSPPIYNQDGFGYSGKIAPEPLEENIVMTSYNQWPKGFYKSVLAFAGGIFDGQSIWMVPANADSVVKVDKDTGVMTGYNKWPKGFRKGNLAFAGGIFDGKSIWMVPSNADRVVSIDTATGEMTGYDGWPEGFVKGGHAFAGGIFDGQSIWIVPSYADRVVRIDTATGEMTGHNKWPAGFKKGGYAFAGGIFDGQSIWMVPANADRVVSIDTATGEMTGHNKWPEGLKLVEYAFAGGVFDGQCVWMIPYYADRVVRIDTKTGEMTGCHQRPQGLGKTEYAFAGGVFDGSSVWMVPLNADRVIRIDKDTSDTTEYDKWPAGFTKGVNAFAGGVFDGEDIWMVPSYADKVMRISSFTSLSVSANLAANDSFYFYISQDEFTEGSLIGQGKGWSSVYSVNAALVPGVTNYLHVKCTDMAGPVAAFIGDFTVNDRNFHFMNGTQKLLTGEDCWNAFSGSFGVKQEKVTEVYRNGLGPWSTRFGIDLNASWIWTGDGKDLGTMYFSTPIYYSAVPVDPARDVRLISSVGDPKAELDEGSFSRKPESVVAKKGTTVVEWRFEKILMGQREEVFFNVLVKDPAAGEDRQVISGLDVVYSDSEGKTVRREFGPSNICVIQSAFTSTVTTDRAEYKTNDDITVAGTVGNLSERGRTVDVKVLIEDGQGVVIEESTIAGIEIDPGGEKTIDGLVFKLVATNAGDHRARLVAYEDRKQVNEACAAFVIEEAPPQAQDSVEEGKTGEAADAEAVSGPVEDAGKEEEQSVAQAPAQPEEQAAEIEQAVSGEVDGTITAQPELIYKGLSETISYKLTNVGAGVNESNLTVSLAIVDPVSCETRQVFTAPKAHYKGDTIEGVFTFSTSPYEPGRYAAVLQTATGSNGEPRSIASTYFEVRLINVVVT